MKTKNEKNKDDDEFIKEIEEYIKNQRILSDAIKKLIKELENKKKKNDKKQL